MPKNNKNSRLSLIEQASKLFSEKGYRNTSIADIAKACGLGKATIYHHIRNKTALAKEVLERTTSQFIDQCSAVMNANNLTGEQKIARFQAVVRDFYQLQNDRCIMTHFILEVWQDEPELQQPIKAFFDYWQECVKTLLGDVVDEAQTRDFLALDIIAQFQGAQIMQKVYQDAPILERASQSFSKLALAHE